MEPLHCVGFLISVNNGVVVSAKQNKVFIFVPFCSSLVRVIPWTSGLCSFYVADFAYDCLVGYYGEGAFRERTLVT
jgi:hypothetical protein